MKRVTIILTIIGIVAVTGMPAFMSMVRRGFSAHAEPTWVETVTARRMRSWVAPSELRTRKVPVHSLLEVQAEGWGAGQGRVQRDVNFRSDDLE